MMDIDLDATIKDVVMLNKIGGSTWGMSYGPANGSATHKRSDMQIMHMYIVGKEKASPRVAVPMTKLVIKEMAREDDYEEEEVKVKVQERGMNEAVALIDEFKKNRR